MGIPYPVSVTSIHRHGFSSFKHFRVLIVNEPPFATASIDWGKIEKYLS